MAIRTDRSLWAWGHNSKGQLGDGTSTADRRIPTMIIDIGNCKAVSAASDHTICIKTDGSLYAWGYNYSGQLGDGTKKDKNIPTKIGTSLNWSKISAGDRHTVAIKADGILLTWGGNFYGQLGDGTKTDRSYAKEIACSTTYIEEKNIDRSVIIYPNPTKNQINIKVETCQIGSNYAVYDSMGEIVLSGTIDCTTSRIDLTDLLSGLYLFTFGEGSNQIFKVIKE